MSMRAQNYLSEMVAWRESADPVHPYVADFDGGKGAIRLNDFPEEHLYTLIVDDVEIADFSDWPKQWTRP